MAAKSHTAQSAFTLVTPVIPEKLPDLIELLDSIGDDINENPHVRFRELRGLHYASFVVIGADTRSPRLIFEGNVDGTPQAFVAHVVNQAGKAVDAIYAHCTDYPIEGTPQEVIDYLMSSDIGSNTFYVAWPGMSVDDICREAQLRERLGELIDQDRAALVRESPADIRAYLQQSIREEPEFQWAQAPAQLPFLVRRGKQLVIFLAGLAAVGALAAIAVAPLSILLVGATVGALAIALRKSERADDRSRTADWESVYSHWNENLAGVVRRENVQAQNHLASVCDIKPGRFRLIVLRAVLWTINLAARVLANKGSLGGIPTIHFARWVITPDNRQLIFFSNFDGSWERYLNDFIDLASRGLTAVWTNSDNAIGFPKTRWLLLQGARDEQRFKAYARFSQARTQLWYSAYPNLSVENIANNRAIRQQLFKPLDETGTRAWLKRL